VGGDVLVVRVIVAGRGRQFWPPPEWYPTLAAKGAARMGHPVDFACIVMRSRLVSLCSSITC